MVHGELAIGSEAPATGNATISSWYGATMTRANGARDSLLR
jgi:hypothetical protein